MSSKTQELLKFQCCIKIWSSNVGVSYFVWNFKVPFEIPLKIAYPFIAFNSQVKIEELLDLRAHKPFLNGPQDIPGRLIWVQSSTLQVGKKGSYQF